MKSLWSDQDDPTGEALALRTYSARLLGAETTLVLHGGGNTSLKGFTSNLFGDRVEVLWIKASGADLATLGPQGHVACDLALLRRLEGHTAPDDTTLSRLLRATLLDPASPTPSIEAAVHALLPAKLVDHTHADAILALTNRPDGESVVRAALGDEVIVLPYVEPGLELARVSAAALRAQPNALGMVWRKHGLVTWGETARESYERMIELVTRAEAYCANTAGRSRPSSPQNSSLQENGRHGGRPLQKTLVRGALALPQPDGGWRRVILRSMSDPETLAALELPAARRLLESAPLTGDHLIRTGRRPLWIEEGESASPERLRATLDRELSSYVREERQLTALAGFGETALEVSPRVVLVSGAGALAVGFTAREADIAADITRHTLAVKRSIAEAGGSYEGLTDDETTVMLYRGMQAAKLPTHSASLAGTVAMVTGAAGAIGAGICRVLAEAGACVAVTDLPGAPLASLTSELRADFPRQIFATPLDVTDPASVAAAFDAVTLEWGGVDLVVANAGAAHVARLEELELEAFRRLERINSEGTLILLAEALRHFRHQGTGGDIVLISTKNVFAPGASFGAYSASKAAAHQLARIASLEGAEIDVRVNMVAPDAVFSDGERKSGLWQEVGPARMKARGLDEVGLEEYYRSRNLLKAKITARHVGEAVLFFALRKTPTTGATLPVDGGLPDATPR